MNNMDLKLWCRFWFANVFMLFVYSVVAASQNICTPGLKTPGYTFPHGDILIEYGEPLDIVCVLHDNVALKQGPNASLNLMYNRNNEIVPSNMIEIINATSIRLHMDKPEKVSSDSYTCLLNNKKNATASVCMNLVTVGTKPQLVDDFECIGYNYDNLTCTWTPPQNYVNTEYNLTFSLRGRASRYVNNACPDMKYPTDNDADKKMSCFWNISTTPQYRQAHQEFYFTLTMRNALGTNQINKTFKHFQHVLSGPPENLTAISTTTSSIYLYWMVPSSMQSFPPGVDHRVWYQCEYGERKWHFGGLITNETHSKEVKYNLTGLKYAHALCDIRVSIRSTASLAEDETMWSRNASITVRTSSKIPDEPPRTNIGSFEIVAFGNNLQFREAYIYWQQILEEQKNGPDFKYYINVDGNDTILPIELTNAYAKFKNLSISTSYKFNIWSRNSNGKSNDKSIVIIPKQTERVSEPMSFTKVEFPDGKYELTWEPPKLMSNQRITNYTIFWCSNERDRPYQCTGKLNWKVVPNDRTVHNETVPKNTIYQFAISANTKYSSSGMLWAACTVIHNKNMGKMKNVWINRLGSTFIEVGWKLDCSDRIGSVEGFIIYYCPILSPSQADCKGPQKNITFYGDTSVLGGNITNLTPYTTYMLTVAVITKHTTFSQQSDPLFNTTLEAAPSTPPLDLQIVDITNSSISISWHQPNATNGMLKNYIINYNNDTMKIDPKTEITLNHLASYENYLISIKACTTMCSNSSEILNVTTKMGYPGKIRQPSVTFQNDSFINILWDRPFEARGRNDYFEVQIKQKYQYENKTIPLFRTTNRTYGIENCGDGGKYNTFYISVRAVNIIDDVTYAGPWSDELESYCRTNGNYMVYILGTITIIFIAAMVYLVKRLYERCEIMRDVEVKLPPGLAPVVTDHTLVPWSAEKHAEEPDHHSPADEELLLVKMGDGGGGGGGVHLGGDSSGCSSGHASVASSVGSGSQISNTSDSGTEQPYEVTSHSQPSSFVLSDDSDKNVDAVRATVAAATAASAASASAVVATATPAYIPYEVSTNHQPTSPYILAGDTLKIVADKPYVKATNLSGEPESCELSTPTTTTTTNQASPYVMTGDAPRPDDEQPYISWNMSAPSYVMAGNIRSINDQYITSPRYIKAGDESTPPRYIKAGDPNIFHPEYIPFNH